MEEKRPIVSQQLYTAQVIVRLVFRLLLLAGLATFSPNGFGPTLATLSAFTAIFCVVAGAMRREPIFTLALTHWDEAAVYAVIGHFALALS